MALHAKPALVRLPALVFVLVVGLATNLSLARAQGEKHWPGSEARQVEVVDALPTRLASKVERALADWERSGVVTFLVRRDGSEDCDSLPDGVVRLCWRSGLRSDGEATTASYDEHITSALVAIEVQGAKRARAVLCHEVGHALGLVHRSSGKTCMTHPIDPRFATPDELDFQTLRSVYSHSD